MVNNESNVDIEAEAVHIHHHYYKVHPITKVIKPFVKEIDDDPRVQLRIHTVGFWYWTINFPLITYMFFYLPDVWLKYGLFITLIYSIYANWTSDYTGMSSSQSVINTSDVNVNTDAVIVDSDKQA